MSESHPEPGQSPWYRWPGEWRRDEKFWREVATRTIAGVLALWIVSSAAWLFLVVTGYLAQPKSWATVIFGFASLVMGLFWLSIVWGFVRTFKDEDMRWMRFGFAWGLILFGVLFGASLWGFVAGLV
jgi:hypothetical protein